MPHTVTLPQHHTLVHLKTTDSTNSEAFRRSEAGAEGGLWIVADAQEKGRGRSGRLWVSEPGNLYTSLLVKLDCPLEAAVQLSFVAAVSAAEAVSGFIDNDEMRSRVSVKWPNDILLDRCKLGGILLESVSSGEKHEVSVVIGIGLNLVSHPALTGVEVTNLGAHGINISRWKAFEALAQASERWLNVWDKGKGFEGVRRKWLDYAAGIGERVCLHYGEEQAEGTFLGIDGSGALILKQDDGEEKRITAGDVFLVTDPRAERDANG